MNLTRNKKDEIKNNTDKLPRKPEKLLGIFFQPQHHLYLYQDVASLQAAQGQLHKE